MRSPFLIPNPKRNQLQNVLLRQIYHSYCTILWLRNGKTYTGLRIAIWHFHPKAIHEYRAYCSTFKSSKKRKYPDPFLRFLLPKILIMSEQLGFKFRPIDAITCIGTNIQCLSCHIANTCTCCLYVNIPFMTTNLSSAIHNLTQDEMNEPRIIHLVGQ